MSLTLLFLIISTLFVPKVFTAEQSLQESCSRVAVVNYQEVVMDYGQSLKGEGLRHYLAKDAEALSYLDLYQQNARPSFKKSMVATTGVLLALLSMTTDDNHSPPYNSTVLLSTGIGLIIVNLIYNKARSVQNEDNLMKAIELYNLRQDPKILLPEAGSNKTTSALLSPPTLLALGVQWRF